MSFRDLALVSLDTISGYDLTSGLHLFTLDELSSATISQTQEKQDIVGKLGRKLSSFKKNKAVNVSATNGLVSSGLFELQTGGKFVESNDVSVRVSEELTATVSEYVAASAYATGTTYYSKTTGTNGNPDTYSVADGVNAENVSTYYILRTKVITSQTASGGLGSEIVDLDVINADNTVSAKLDQNSSVAKGKFKYTPGTKTIEFDGDDVAVGARVVVYYDYKTTANILQNYSDTYSGKCRLYVDATAEDICGKVYRVQFHIPKADVNGEFSLEMGDNQTVHAFEAEALSGACGTGAVFFDYIVYGVESDNAA